jgi:threonine 3-dehydrogenase
MRALQKSRPAIGLNLVDAPAPEISPSEVLVKIDKVAICGTDLHIYQWDHWAQQTLQPPVIAGHEFIGRIEQIGDHVHGLKVGQRVSGEGHVVCGICRNCRAGRQHYCRSTEGIGIQRDGAFAEYLALPASNVFAIPDGIPDHVAAIFDPYGNAVHTALSFPLVGEDVLITGAGPVGSMAAAIARKSGARHVVVTDVNPYRLELAQALGATRVVLADREPLPDVMQELGMSEGFDIGMEMSGHPAAFNAMIDVMNHGSSIALLGILPNSAINWNDIVFRSITLKGIYGREMYDTWYKMVTLLEAGLQIEPIITHTLPFEGFEEGFSLMREGQCGKVILSME